MRRANTDPEDVIAKADQGYAKEKRLKKSDFNDVVNKALSELERRESGEGREAARARRLKLEDEAAVVKQAEDLRYGGMLNSEWLITNKDRFSAPDYRHYHELLRKDKDDRFITDPQIYTDLLTRLAQDDADLYSIQKDAMDAFNSYHLKPADLRDIISDINTEKKQRDAGEGMPRWYGGMRDYLFNALKPSDFDQYNNNKQGQDRSEAIFELRRWAREHPQATETEAQEMTRTINGRVREKQAREATEQAARPDRKYLPAEPNAVTDDDLKKAGKALSKDFDDGLIEDTKYNSEKAKLNKLLEALRLKQGIQPNGR